MRQHGGMSAEAEIVADNIRLAGAAMVAAAFDELKLFDVVDRLVELFQDGQLPIGNGRAGKQLRQYWREAPDRPSAAERRSLYARTLGMPAGEPGVAVNRAFPDLWLRFISCVASLAHKAPPSARHQQELRDAARDLAVNMSAQACDAMVHAATGLRKQVEEMTRLLSDKELQSAVGARDLWGVVDRIAGTELGGARNDSRYRTLATSGATITNWLADRADRLCDPARPIIDLGAAADRALVKACEAANLAEVRTVRLG